MKTLGKTCFWQGPVWYSSMYSLMGYWYDTPLILLSYSIFPLRVKTILHSNQYNTLKSPSHGIIALYTKPARVNTWIGDRLDRNLEKIWRKISPRNKRVARGIAKGDEIGGKYERNKRANLRIAATALYPTVEGKNSTYFQSMRSIQKILALRPVDYRVLLCRSWIGVLLRNTEKLRSRMPALAALAIIVWFQAASHSCEAIVCCPDREFSNCARPSRSWSF